ncbi:tRNA epoxyqueuosine(34) reductase QueG [Echinimonas agarilytica]|uniref:Epoxyqueuosine reductase n=1 Tax=Echinimonas agarilytica TaxID=1215918 RepID=A0AA42B6B3_9GAMM|nr:tRNA epoxyqueuosine(34) reductase QueG [Echinimonas agarilytica]MCM2678459.1 tRNA epoxyqueuosine(34) reductase QueG [Echinimonas agarilytica]
MSTPSETDLIKLANNIRQWAKELGLNDVGISDIDLSENREAIETWLENGYHGTMSFLERNGELRLDPSLLHPGTVRVISVRMDYLPEHARFASDLEQRDHAYISRYAVGRDYHKVMRKRIKQLGDRIAQEVESLNARPFVDSAPVLERPIAQKAGLGWIGKHSLLLNAQSGSWFFLGELMVNLPLPVTSDAIQENQCGECVACIKICPTDAIVSPYTVDARRCISYLTIEHEGSIDEALRPLMGNRIYGCDDCQLICPWNRHAEISPEPDYQHRAIWDDHSLITLFQWSEDEFLSHTAGSPIRRIGFERWQRNIAIAIGNASASEAHIAALQQPRQCVSDVVDEHIDWALQRQQQALSAATRKTARLIRSVRQGLPRDAD